MIIKRESTRATQCVLAALILLFVGGNRIVSTLVVHSLEKQYPPLEVTPEADVIVVLGGGTRSQSPPRLSSEINEAGDRLLYAARLYHAGAAPVILVSGGQAKWTGPPHSSGATAMSEILQLTGVPEHAITIESDSTNTYENALATAVILEKLQYDEVILVTSAMHMPRSMGVFSTFDLTIIPAPTDFQVTYQDIEYAFHPDPRIQLMNIMPNAGNLEVLTRAIKEYIGIFIYRLRGWI